MKTIRTAALLTTLLTVTSAHALDVAGQKHLFEFGPYGGITIMLDDHALRGNGVPHQKIDRPTAHIGGRIGYLPLSWMGIELEGGGMPAKTDAGDATLFTVRSHLLFQLPKRFAPFVVVGGGILGVSSSNAVLGDDIDFAFHWGPGFKFYATEWLALRVDARQLISGRVVGTFENHFEVLGGLSVVLGWSDSDRDGDGVIDKRDRCPDTAARTLDGCPPPDRDGDGILDADDRCPDQAAQTPDGCPAPAPAAAPKDTDEDGIPDDRDACPDEAATTEDGCPVKDADNDGILAPADKCPNEAETKNGYEDEDGCPDELPQEVKRFSGKIEGIRFALGKAEIASSSFAMLDEAAKVLAEYPDLKLLIEGHSDSSGSRRYNIKLSEKRAAAVRDYLVEKGIATERLSVEGVGPDRPIADNKTAAGRKENRRIEFKLQTAE